MVGEWSRHFCKQRAIHSEDYRRALLLNAAECRGAHGKFPPRIHRWPCVANLRGCPEKSRCLEALGRIDMSNHHGITPDFANVYGLSLVGDILRGAGPSQGAHDPLPCFIPERLRQRARHPRLMLEVEPPPDVRCMPPIQVGLQRLGNRSFTSSRDTHGDISFGLPSTLGVMVLSPSGR